LHFTIAIDTNLSSKTMFIGISSPQNQFQEM